MTDVSSPSEPTGRESLDDRAEDILGRLRPIPPRITPDDIAQMQAALAAEGYAWVHPLDGSPKRLEKVARLTDDARQILEGAARGITTQTAPTRGEGGE